ncbi:MAG TPA: 1,4-alpha-glucan branching protein domain-containing protein, partial [Burkholderiales bacterium]|nr:1,4-alpha-glucan branching protein domain-containing protein [Burkholderiales bacterium]
FLPLMESFPEAMRAQIFIARDHYRETFGRDPAGMWLPECAYVASLGDILAEANIRWFVIDAHGLMFGTPRPRYAIYTPCFTPAGPAVFGRDRDSSRQVWSAEEGYPGDPAYRDFYRDIGFDLSIEYLRDVLPPDGSRKFTGLKYHRITGRNQEKGLYNRGWAMGAVDAHAGHFMTSRRDQFSNLRPHMNVDPIVVSPFDAELFGHWWFEGPEFIDQLARRVCQNDSGLTLITPSEYLRRHPTNQVATPAASSWGEDGHLKVWLNEKNEWIQRHLHGAQQRMTELARRFEHADALTHRALQQAARELLLAQSSDWPFIIHTGTSPGYARQRVETHLARFNSLYGQLTRAAINEPW